MTITEFLLKRIAEDEADARDYWPGLAGDYPGAPHDFDQRLARALAECEAKRVAVDWYLNDDATVMAPTIRAFAAVYADHPDYDEAWRP